MQPGVWTWLLCMTRIKASAQPTPRGAGARGGDGGGCAPADPCHASSWAVQACRPRQGGDDFRNDEHQGNRVICQMYKCFPLIASTMRDCILETGVAKLLLANITAGDPAEMVARGKYILSQFGLLVVNCAVLVGGYAAGGTAVTVARRKAPKQFLHYYGAVASPLAQRGYTAFLLQVYEADEPYYYQQWKGMILTTPITGTYGDGSLPDDVIEYAKTNEELGLVSEYSNIFSFLTDLNVHWCSSLDVNWCSAEWRRVLTIACSFCLVNLSFCCL